MTVHLERLRTTVGAAIVTTLGRTPMPAETTTADNFDAARGLPPVQAPSGRFIVQLFLVPMLIVAVVCLIVLGFTWLAGGETSADKLLERLESQNAEVRWRAANEIAQRLKRDDELASNPQLALRLTGLLHRAAEELNQIPPSNSDAERLNEKKGMLEKRKDVEFLAPCVGSMMVPAGMQVLCDIAVNATGRDPNTNALLRRQAVWALAKMGVNVKRFSSLPSARKDKILNDLRAASAAGGEQGQWAARAYDCLQGNQKNLGVIPALADCAKADEPFLRTLVAMALTFWEGEGDEKRLAEKTLQMLSFDDGHGTRIEIGDAD